jgi:hypothetical protein
MAGVVSEVGRPASPFLRELCRALAHDARAEVEMAAKVGTLLALGHSQAEIAYSLDISQAEIRAAVKRLRRVAPQIETSHLPAELSPDS